MNIVCLDAKGICIDNSELNIFKKFGNITVYDTTEPEQTIERLKDADIVITTKVLLTKEILEKTHLKLICIAATGTNNVDIESANKLNIPVKNVANYSTNSVVQQTFANLLELTNKTSFYKSYSIHEWSSCKTFSYFHESIMEISNKNFGVIGLGHIGKKVAQIASAFGANVNYYSTSGKHNDPDFKQISLDELLKNSDIISVHAPLNDKTKNLISTRELNLLKDNAILMNFGRGGIINETELAKAMDEKNIKVALDVLEKEPIDKNHPLLKIKNSKNLLITPHIAWASAEARKKLLEILVQNVEDFLKNNK